jgi:hypothetical protein
MSLPTLIRFLANLFIFKYKDSIVTVQFKNIGRLKLIFEMNYFLFFYTKTAMTLIKSKYKSSIPDTNSLT